jgi:HK97 family phage prohead protease
MTALQRAAEARSAGVRAPADRPSHRRSEEHGYANVTRAIPAVMTMRAAESGSGLLEFSGHASTYEQDYDMWDEFGPYTEVVSRGAGAASLAQPGLDCPLVLDHESIRRIASTANGSLTITEDEVGLLCLAPSLDPTDYDVAYIAPKMRAGLITEMSFRFRITSGVWSPDYTEYRINAFDINRGDVSIVGFGANPATSSTLRDAAVPALTRACSVTDSDTAHWR